MPTLLFCNGPKFWTSSVIFSGLSLLFIPAIFTCFVHFAFRTITLGHLVSTPLCVNKNLLFVKHAAYMLYELNKASNQIICIKAFL